MLSSAVFIHEPPMKVRRYSSSASSFLGFTIQSTMRISNGMNQTRIMVFTTLKKVWKKQSAHGRVCGSYNGESGVV